MLDLKLPVVSPVMALSSVYDPSALCVAQTSSCRSRYGGGCGTRMQPGSLRKQLSRSFIPLYASGSKNKSTGCCTAASSSEAANQQAASKNSDEYNQVMKRQMKNPYEYHHELGMFYTRITEKLLIGSQPQSKDDIEQLFFVEGVGSLVNLQQDHDIAYWGIDINPIMERCDQLGVRYYRIPARDFDPHSLRAALPQMVAAIANSISNGKTVYVHCTAGLGRAPAAAIAYLFWFEGMTLDEAYEFVTSKRPCGPKREAIRGATYDLAKNSDQQPPFEELPDFAFNNVAQWERQLIQDRVRPL